MSSLVLRHAIKLAQNRCQKEILKINEKSKNSSVTFDHGLEMPTSKQVLDGWAVFSECL